MSNDYEELAVSTARHEGWMAGFKEAVRLKRNHGWAMYIYGLSAGVGLATLFWLFFLLNHWV